MLHTTTASPLPHQPPSRIRVRRMQPETFTASTAPPSPAKIAMPRLAFSMMHPEIRTFSTRASRCPTRMAEELEDRMQWEMRTFRLTALLSRMEVTATQSSPQRRVQPVISTSWLPLM